VQAVGDAGFIPANITIPLSGVQAVAAVGNLQVQRTNAIIGNIVAGAVQNLGVVNWILIDDSQNPGWALIDDSQNPGWALIDDSQNPGWALIDTVVA